jgi:hypothetical protein
MAKGKIISLSVLVAVLLVSCDLLLPDSDSPLNRLGENEFYAINMTNSKFYKVSAEILYEGKRCVVWAEKGSGVTKVMAKNIGVEYDTIIRPGVVGAFSMKNVSTEDKKYTFVDMLDYANWLVGRSDRKLTILLLDIQDGFKNKETDSYVAGYFFNGDFYKKGKISATQYSNGRDMIYIDTSPGLDKNLEQVYATFAHELQHLINFVTSLGLSIGSMDTWIDEGLSSQAEYLCYGEAKDKCEWFSEDPAGTIARGNNFFVWGNNTGNPVSILDDYNTVYLFFRWLYLQASADLQENIFLEIVKSSSRDYRAVTSVAKKIKTEWGSWEPLLRTWLAANYYPKNTTYGYKDNQYLQDTIKVNPIAGDSVTLYPGEGVYSVINSSFTKDSYGNIRYAGLSAMGTVNTSSPYTGDILLTFNANTNKAGGRENGSLTGVSPSVSPSRMMGKGDQPKKMRVPYVIDARDMVGRDSW